MLNLAYVLTSNGCDKFADMALVSMLSVRISNPGCRIVLLCDAKSARGINSAKHRVLDVCDEMISVDTPAGNPTFRNRWIKTQLSDFISGPCLYIDADTLVRGSLEPLTRLQSDFAAVANHNGKNLAEQIWDEDRAVLVKMGWPTEFNFYANGGVFFFNGKKASQELFATWHRLWKESYLATGRFRDQPSLNTALTQAPMKVECLPNSWNGQVISSPVCAFDASIWHFYSSMNVSDVSLFSEALISAQALSSSDLRISIKKVLRKRVPWTKKSSGNHVENTIWGAYRQGARLRWSEIRLLLIRRANWKNVLLTIFNAFGLPYTIFFKSLGVPSRFKKLIKIK